MKIKNKLALNFSLITAGILLLILLAIFLAFYSFVRADFYEHLNDRAKVAAQLYLEADEISSDSLGHVREQYLAKLPQERIGIYNERNESFLAHKNSYWTDKVIDRVRKKEYLQFAEGNRQTVGVYYRDNQGNFVILVSAVDADHNDQLVDIARIMLVAFIVINGAVFFIGRRFAQRSLSPINDLISQMQQITVNDLHVRVREGEGKDEITELARNFNRLLEHLYNAFELQQTFVTNASHELRTPVTSIIGEIEVGLKRERSAAEYQQLLASVLNDAENLNDTISSLMELAQSDLEYTRAKLTPVMIDELIWEIHHYWNTKKEKGKLIVEMQHMPEDANHLVMMVSKPLLIIALNNIIGNAFKFSGGKPVVCTLNVDDKLIKIAIRDGGIGIPAEDIDKIFNSFYRSPNGRSFKGSGIGLYITRKIVQLFGGTITVTPAQPGSVFLLTFPQPVF
ncbi:signal transduction histidine kinase [Mucilaginibacter oryzae]|uniref:histidine kinase n=1 Tax=Mucilaginibacter oryzae TaxID=468058 RepID=A0A316HDG1_9SPHI|nr:HAMP domain-containing sensor histidine kinase [Mucilaginibacter oryzae]PWK79194.1 signal transduction histidine kinase [Mucilaginibacter oryzae]